MHDQTTGGPMATCWHCEQRYLVGCVHHCPTAVTPKTEYAIIDATALVGLEGP